MKVTYNWLKEFVEIDIPPSELAVALTMAGLEVESVEDFGTELDNIVVSKILDIQPHPDADKLVVCRIDDGETQSRIVVCGAKNMKTGDKVPLAKPGATLKSLKDGEMFTLKKSKLRGVESDGMLCSDVELGLGADSKGLMILPEEMIIGVPFADALGMRDTAFEVAVMPNRPDVASVIGIAREVSAILNKPLKNRELKIVETGKDASEWTSVEILDYALCPRYAAKIITEAKVQPSPMWMKLRLERCGVRSISNLVDITNYVLLETGHPMHAFDYEKLDGRRIIVRRAKEGEEIITLDGQSRKLTSEMLVIADEKKAVALAGIMGCANSEVSQDTKILLLESAYFNPSNIRRTSKKLGLQSEASYRFERGADPQIQVHAAQRVCELILETSGGIIQKGVVDTKKDVYTSKPVQIRISRTNKVLGTSLSHEEISGIFRRLHFPVSITGADTIEVVPSSYRVDLEREIDLIEEVARIYGYNNIPTPVSVAKVLNYEASPITACEKITRDAMTAFGFFEIINCNLINPKSLEKIASPDIFKNNDVLSVLNPVSVELSAIRPTLIPGMLETIQRNIYHSQLNLRLFELGHAHLKSADVFPVERLLLTCAVSGSRNAEGWNTKPEEVDFYDLKGTVEALFDVFGENNLSFRPVENTIFIQGCASEVLISGKRIGIAGEIQPRILNAFDINRRVFLAEINMGEIIGTLKRQRAFTQIPAFPGISRDVAIILDNSVSFDSISEVIKELRISILENFMLFDVYHGEQAGKGKKSMALSLFFRSREKTLRDADVDKVFDRIKKALIEKTSCVVREG
jgi:phenylalanyl-tRNA synthetase beta chain